MTVATIEEPAVQRSVAPAPVPLSHGSYAIYGTPEGGLHLVYRTKGSEKDDHLEVPSFVLGMARKAAAGQDLGPLGFLLGEAAA